MKVVHTLLRYPPASGGVEEYTRELVERLRAHGEDIRVETTNLRTHHPPSVLDPAPDDPPYVHRHEAQTFSAVGYPIPVGLRDELTGIPADIIHAHAFWYAPADIAARVAKKRRIPFVLNPYYYNTGNRRTMKWQLYRILHGRATVAAADAVVVISPFEHELLKKDRFLLQRVELIPPGITVAEFDRTYPNPYDAWGLDGREVLLFAGRVAKSKGLDLLLRAFAIVRREVPAVHLVITGEDFGFRDSGQKLAADLGLKAAITWKGKVSRADLLGAYAHARAFVFPSRFEAFGIVLLEAGAMGCPVIATRGSAIPYVVRDETTGLLVEPESIDDLTKKILLVLHDRGLARRLGTEARKRARTEFPWGRSVAKLHALYTNLLSRRT